MVKSVVFDMDGLMFDTERIWMRCWKPALESLGMTYKEGLDEAARGTSGESMRRVLHQFYGEDADVSSIEDALYRTAAPIFAKPVPKMKGLDALLNWLRDAGIPMAVASSSRMPTIMGHLNNWDLAPYFKAVISGDFVTRSKPDPEIFLTAAKALGTAPAETLVLEDSYNGVRAGAAGGFITVMVPDLAPVTDEMRRLYTAECKDLNEVKKMLEEGRL